jgi:endonuclease YncB( thermonuclease family)
MEARTRRIIALVLLLGGCQKQEAKTDAIAQTVTAPIAQPSVAISPKSSLPRNLKIKVGLDSPSDLKVTVGMPIKAGQVISDRASLKQPLIEQRQTLDFQLQQLQQQQQYQIALSSAQLEPLKLSVQNARLKLKRFKESRRYTNRAYQQFPTLASGELSQETELEQTYTSARTALRQAEANLKAAKLQGQNQQRSLLRQIANLDRQILATGVTRSPYTGTVKRIKFTGQNNTELLAEITISTEAAKLSPIATENSSPSNNRVTATDNSEVISVHDGDTIRTREYRIRLACIDAPELAQPLGYKSRDNLRSLIAQNNNRVRLQIVETDRYGRKVALIYANGKLLNLQQVTDGMAYVYKRYLSSCPQSESVLQAETIAKQQQRGVWGGNNQPPWEFRHDKRRN